MNNKGFTLIELLAVVILLITISLFAMPRVADIIKEGNETKEDITKNKIIDAAKEYTNNYDTEFLNDFIYTGYTKYISKEELVNNNLLDINEIDSIGFFKVKVTLKENNKLEYTISYDDSIRPILTINLDGGSITNNPTGEYDVGSTITLINPTKTGYVFSHWSIEVGNSILSGNKLTLGNSDTKIKANWIKNVTLTVDLDGGTNNSQSGKYNEKSTITLDIPTRDNYVFLGWKIVSGDGIISGNNLTFASTDVSVVALWIKEKYEYAYTGSEQKFTVPISGYYKIETWGAQGGGDSSYPGGYGGYSYGTVFLTAGQTLYISVGSSGSYSTGDATAAGGYNGGGTGGCDNDNSYGYCGGGGGATHIATTSGLLSTLSSNQSSIIIVAGGGGGRGGNGNSNNGTVGSSSGGSGGGIIGSSGAQTVGTNATGGSQTSGGTGSAAGSFGKGGSDSSTNAWGRGGGGAGFYGGGSGLNSSGAGGSSYIGNSLLTDKVMYCYNCTTSNGTDVKTVSTTCTNSNPTSNCTKQGNGYAKISFVSVSSKDERVETSKEFESINKEQKFTIQVSGYYKLETWGAQGGGDSSYPGGYGGYSSGLYYLEKGQTIYINVGSSGSYSTEDATAAGGYNGGGTGGCDNDNSYGYCGGGGGATHIATKSGLLSTLSSNQSSILIVSGGGGGRGGNGGSDHGTVGSSSGGSGGGILGSKGAQTVGNQNGIGGSQTNGGTGSVTGSFGQGGSDSSTNAWGRGGGGAGFYGGGSGLRSSGAGGSGYIGNSLLTDKVMYCYNCTASGSYSAKTISTTCTNEAAVEKCSKKGNGYAKVSLVEGVTPTYFSKNDFEEKYYNGTEQTFTAPLTGYYKLEVWGAQGGGDSSYPGGYGGYSSGSYYLEKGQTIYITIGGSGSYSTDDATAAGGYNGGGTGGCDNDNSYGYCGGGGGATHIATKSGLLSTLSSNQSSIIIVAGGGGGRGGNGNSGNGTVGSSSGGSGGGITGSSGAQTVGNQNGTGGSQTSGGTGSVTGSFGQGGSDSSTNAWGRGGGGAGFYGGGSGFRSSGAGGSGYIGNSLLTNKVMYCYNCSASTDTNTKTISTTCTNEAAVEKCSKQGNGHAKITYIGE